MNTPGNFELAKLLKEKGFDNYTPLKYFSKKPSGYGITNWSENIAYSCEDIYSQLRLGYNEQTYFIWAPTIVEVVMWLYEKYGIWTEVKRIVLGSDEWGFEYIISYLPKEFETAKKVEGYVLLVVTIK